MKSIRLYLLFFLLVALLVATAAIGTLVYFSTRHEVNEMYSLHLLQLGNLLSAQQIDRPGCGWSDNVSSVPERDGQRLDESEFAIQIFDLHGHLLHASHPALKLALQPHVGFNETVYGGRSWQIYRADNLQCIVQIGQPALARREAMHEITHHILGPAALQLPLLVVLMWLAVGRGLRPLQRLSAAIRRRSPAVLEPVDDRHLPREVLPLVQALNDLLRRLDEALRAQRQFTADAAHELRSPLAALQLQLQLAQRADSEAARSAALAQLGAGIQRGNRLVQQLLTLARLDPEAPLQAPVRIALDQLACGVVAEASARALARNIDLGIERCEPVQTEGDANSLEILLGNLVENAIRYTPDGGRIDVNVRPEGAYAVIDVIDTGCGIAEADRERVFDRFYRGQNAREGESAAPGTGLGLAIVRAIVERHGGSIEVHDNPAGQGTLMRVRLPRAS